MNTVKTWLCFILVLLIQFVRITCVITSYIKLLFRHVISAYTCVPHWMLLFVVYFRWYFVMAIFAYLVSYPLSPPQQRSSAVPLQHSSVRCLAVPCVYGMCHAMQRLAVSCQAWPSVPLRLCAVLCGALRRCSVRCRLYIPGSIWYIFWTSFNSISPRVISAHNCRAAPCHAAMLCPALKCGAVLRPSLSCRSVFWAVFNKFTSLEITYRALRFHFRPLVYSPRSPALRIVSYMPYQI